MRTERPIPKCKSQARFTTEWDCDRVLAPRLRLGPLRRVRLHSQLDRAKPGQADVNDCPAVDARMRGTHCTWCAPAFFERSCTVSGSGGARYLDRAGFRSAGRHVAGRSAGLATTSTSKICSSISPSLESGAMCAASSSSANAPLSAATYRVDCARRTGGLDRRKREAPALGLGDARARDGGDGVLGPVGPVGGVDDGAAVHAEAVDADVAFGR